MFISLNLILLVKAEGFYLLNKFIGAVLGHLVRIHLYLSNLKGLLQKCST